MLQLRFKTKISQNFRELPINCCGYFYNSLKQKYLFIKISKKIILYSISGFFSRITFKICKNGEKEQHFLFGSVIFCDFKSVLQKMIHDIVSANFIFCDFESLEKIRSPQKLSNTQYSNFQLKYLEFSIFIVHYLICLSLTEKILYKILSSIHVDLVNILQVTFLITGNLVLFI